MERIIEVKHLSKSFGDHKVLRDIDFSVNKGEVVCIIGSSGSGKSTLLRCINLLEKPTGGEIIYNEENILDDKHDIYRTIQCSPIQIYTFVVFSEDQIQRFFH